MKKNKQIKLFIFYDSDKESEEISNPIDFTKPGKSEAFPVILTPMEDGKINFLLQGGVYCEVMESFIKNCGIISSEDLMWLEIFETKENLDKFLKAGHQITKDIPLVQLGYDECEIFVTDFGC